MGDQSGAIHIWDLKTDHNEQLIPEPEVSITSAHIDPDASYMAAVNSTVSGGCLPSLYQSPFAFWSRPLVALWAPILASPYLMCWEGPEVPAVATGAHPGPGLSRIPAVRRATATCGT